MQSRTPKEELYKLIGSFLEGEMTTGSFCSRFEEMYNSESDIPGLSPHEESVLQELFEEVTYFSPFPEDRVIYPGYRNEDQIHAAARTAWHSLKDGD